MNIENNIQYINIENIIPNRFQPRLAFDEEALKNLAQSIIEHGIIQPLVVRRLSNDKYEIIAGERRYKASQMAGLNKLPVIIANLDDNTSAEVALIENIQRKDLSAIEEAKSYKKLLDRGYLTQEELAKRLGVSQSNIANKVRLLNLTEEVQDALMKELISERHARSLLQIQNPSDQINMLNKIISNRLTVRQLDMEIKNLIEGNIERTNENNTESVTKDIERFEIPSEEELDEISRLIIESKNKLNNEYEIFNIPTAEEIKTVETKEVKDQIIEKIEPNNINKVIGLIKDIEKRAKNSGYDIESEEYDFEDLYQIIIKIEK